MSDLTDADLEAMEKRCEEATPGPWKAKCSGHDYPYIEADSRRLGCGEDFAKMTDAVFIAHARTDLPALIAALREARAERNEAIAHDRQPYPTAWAYDRVYAALENHKAENRLLRDMVAEYMLSLKEWSNEYWESRLEVAPLTAAEVARVQRLEKVAEAAKALRSEHRADFMDDGARQDRLYELFQLLDEHDEAAPLPEPAWSEVDADTRGVFEAMKYVAHAYDAERRKEAPDA